MLWKVTLLMLLAVAGVVVAALSAARRTAHRAQVVPAPAVVAPAPPPDDRGAFEGALPAFQKNCFRCHTATGDESGSRPLEMLDMSQYPFQGRRADEAGLRVRTVLGAEGARATMPKDDPGSVAGADLTSIIAWTRVFDAAHPGDPP